MKGKLERDGMGRILCDACGKKKAYYTFKASRLAREFVGDPLSKRKLFYLCLEDCKRFSTLAALGGTD